MNRMRAMRTRCILYSIPFLVVAATMGVFSFVKTTAISNLTDNDATKLNNSAGVMMSLALVKLVSPSNGYFNALIYMRLQIMSWRRRGVTWRVAFQNFMKNQPLPPLTSSTKTLGRLKEQQQEQEFEGEEQVLDVTVKNTGDESMETAGDDPNV